MTSPRPTPDYHLQQQDVALYLNLATGETGHDINPFAGAAGLGLCRELYGQHRRISTARAIYFAAYLHAVTTGKRVFRISNCPPIRDAEKQS